ncbi:hypothetical protein HOY80DRAFT_1006293 [Tuber brumale]|nr:hypothetical protein HOY80DRAFT_1006293 [Tuber brumale]
MTERNENTDDVLSTKNSSRQKLGRLTDGKDRSIYQPQQTYPPTWAFHPATTHHKYLFSSTQVPITHTHSHANKRKTNSAKTPTTPQPPAIHIFCERANERTVNIPMSGVDAEVFFTAVMPGLYPRRLRSLTKLRKREIGTPMGFEAVAYARSTILEDCIKDVGEAFSTPPRDQECRWLRQPSYGKGARRCNRPTHEPRTMPCSPLASQTAPTAKTTTASRSTMSAPAESHG